MELKKLKNIDQMTKDLVNGFIRDIQRYLPNNQTYYNIPSSIKNICILFFYMFDEWNPNMIGKGFTIVNDTKLVSEYSSFTWRAAYLSKMIENGQHIWKFKLVQGNCFMIGIWDCKYDSSITLSGDLDRSDGKSYVYHTYFAHCNKYPNASWEENGSYGQKCKEGDIISMCVDMELLTLSFMINDNDFGKAFDIKNAKYRAAVACYESSYIELLS